MKKLFINFLLTITLTVLILLGIEIFLRIFTKLNLLKSVKPLIIEKLAKRNGSEFEDWRMYQMFEEGAYQYDPVLFWRPKPTSYFNSLGYKGKEPIISDNNKNVLGISNNILKIITYGDSNTQGSPQNSWPEELNIIVKKKYPNVEVYNAGVGGYSSYQGLLRFREDLVTNKPNIILVNFGWGDASPSIGNPDNLYQSETVEFQEKLNSLTLISVIQYYSNIYRNKNINSIYVPRVSIKDYKKNIIEFINLAKKNNVRIILITRPVDLRLDDAFAVSVLWRLLVPRYNDALQQIAKENDVLLFDLNKYFESKKEYYSDECHFTEEGWRVAAEYIFENMVNAGVLEK